MKKIIITLIVIILISNITILKEWSGINSDFYRYSNSSGTYTVHEIYMQGRMIDKKSALGDWDKTEFKKLYPKDDPKLYRLFTVNLLKFWRWAEYIYDWRFRLPYADWHEIETKRSHTAITHNSTYQDF